MVSFWSDSIGASFLRILCSLKNRFSVGLYVSYSVFVKTLRFIEMDVKATFSPFSETRRFRAASFVTWNVSILNGFWKKCWKCEGNVGSFKIWCKNVCQSKASALWAGFQVWVQVCESMNFSNKRFGRRLPSQMISILFYQCTKNMDYFL